MDRDNEDDFKLNANCRHCGSLDPNHPKVECSFISQIVDKVRYGHQGTGIRTMTKILQIASIEPLELLQKLQESEGQNG